MKGHSVLVVCCHHMFYYLRKTQLYNNAVHYASSNWNTLEYNRNIKNIY